MLSSKVNFPNKFVLFLKFKKIFFQIKIISINKDKAHPLSSVHYFRWLGFLWALVFLSILWVFSYVLVGSFPGGSDGKEFACNAGDTGLIPGSGRSSGERSCNPLQYSCLENFLYDREFCGQRGPVSHSPWGHKELDMTDWLTVSLFVGSCCRLFLVGIPVLLNSSLSSRYSIFHAPLKAGSLVIFSMHNCLSGILLPWLEEKVTKLS